MWLISPPEEGSGSSTGMKSLTHEDPTATSNVWRMIQLVNHAQVCLVRAEWRGDPACLGLMVPNVGWSIIKSECLIKSEGIKEVMIASKAMLGLGGVRLL